MIDATRIRRELALRAPRQRVWDALTTAAGWSGWFSDAVEGEFRVGQALKLYFGKSGVCWAIVTERNEMRTLAFQWHPGEDCDLDKYPREQMTTVRFELSDQAEGTLLLLTETGFEKVDLQRRSKCVDLNTEGWDYELDELRSWLEDGVRQSRAGD
jgi:uncharacterized protein YndB with AHSA1/START domain